MRRSAVLSHYLHHSNLFRSQTYSIRDFCCVRKTRSGMTSAKEESVKIDSRLDEVVNNFRKNFALPLPTHGELKVCSESIMVSSKWSFLDTDMEKRTVFNTVSLAAKSEQNPAFKLIQPPTELSESIIFTLASQSNTQLRAVGKEVAKGDKKQQFVEIWKADVRVGVYDSELAGLHGKIITKGDLPSFEWAADESKLLFVAEKKVPKPESFFARKPAADSDIGGLYRWKEDWGEQVDGMTNPVVVVLDVNSMKAEVIQREKSSLGQAVFTPDGKGIVLVELPNTPYRLGAIFCHNRRQQLLFYEFESKKFTELSSSTKCVNGPRFDSFGKTLIFFQNQVGGPHAMTSELVKIDWMSKEKEQKVVVPIPQNPKEDEFPGLSWLTLLTRNCIFSDGKTAFVNSVWHSKLVILRIDLESGSLTNVTPDDRYGAYQLLSVDNDYILAARSSPSIRKHLALAKIGDPVVNWTPVGDVVENPDTKWKVLKLRPKDDPNSYFEAIHIYKDQKQKHPLIVLPHGGPHAASIATYLPTVNYYLDCGYGVLFVNYRGSLGFGETNLRSLPGKVGDVDVKDVYQAAESVVESGVVSELLLLGGSHGGFLVGHLAGQYPSTFKAACLLNPVTDLSMMGPSDIPDWYWTEAGCKGDFQYDSLPTDEDLALMRAKSPVAHAHKIVSPCFFFLGTNDLRVDKGHGIKLYKSLLARGVEVACNMYDDNHSLSEAKHYSDVEISIIKWFDKHTRK